MSLKSLGLVIFLAIFAAESIYADEDYGHYYKTKAFVEADLKNLLKQAKETQKKAVFVIGAHWCGDSKSLAKKMQNPELKAILENEYRLTYVGVDYFSKNMDVSRSLGLPLIYGVPTILIMDLDRKAIANDDTMHQWSNAYDIPVDEIIQYFKDHKNQKAAQKSSLTSEQQQAMQQLSKFEDEQSVNLRKAYDFLKPMLRQAVEIKPAENYRQVWEEVYEYRNRIKNDVNAIKKLIKKQPTPAAIDFPEYKPFSWEDD